MKTPEEILNECNRDLSYHHDQSVKEKLQELIDYIDDSVDGDGYGNGKYIQEFEEEIADLFGKESAVFMPSGTMAQQISLRIWCDELGTSNVTFHPGSHLEFAEFNAYQKLHNLKRIPLGMPELFENKIATASDFKNIKEKLGVILLEIPQRTIGQLNEWGDLVEISEYAKENNIKLHLDGARIWESQPYYGKSFKEIGELFDSIYVSFYKGLNNFNGAMLMGPKKFIEESKVWQRRHGGNLRTQFPYVISAKMAIEKNLPRIPLYVNKAREIAEILNSHDLIAVTPEVPPTNLFNVIIQAPLEKVKETNLAIADKHKIWLFSLKQAFVDKWSQAEINVGESALDLDLDEFKIIMDEFVQLLKQ